MASKKILHLLSAGGMGGIEMLCRDLAEYSTDENDFCFLYGGGIIEQELIRMGKSVYSLYNNSYLKRLLRLVTIVKSQKYDMVIVHHEGNGIYLFFLILCVLFPKKRFVKYLHCAYEEKYMYSGKWLSDKIKKLILQRTLDKSDNLIAVSNFVKSSYVRGFAIDENKIKTVYNGIRIVESNSFFHRKIETDMPVRLLYIGRVIKVKGVDLLLKAVGDLIAEGERIELDILGVGELLDECKQLCSDMRIKDNIRFLGVQLDKEQYYANADIFVYPSVWQEAFGISIIEAMAHGMICVASQVGGIPEIISDGENGYLFEKSNIEQLKEKLRIAIAALRMGEDGSMRLSAENRASEFSIEKTIDGMNQLTMM